MPVKPFKRKPIDERDTFRYSTPNLKEVAHPVSTYVTPKASAQTERLARLIGSSSTPIIQGLSAYDNAQFDKGVQDAEMGKEGEAGFDPFGSYMKGYELQKGKAAGTEYALKAQEIVNNSQDLTPGELREKLEGLHADYITDSSEAFQLGFGPIAKNARTSLYEKHGAMVQKQVEDTYKANIGRGVVGDASVVWAQYKDDPEQYAKKMRKILDYTNANTEGKHTFTSKELLALEIKALGEKAVDSKNPELLQAFFYMNDKGESLVDDPDLRAQASVYLRKAQAERKDQDINAAYDAITARNRMGDGTINLNNAIQDVMNLDVQKELGITGKEALSLRSQFQAALNVERAEIIRHKEALFTDVADKAYNLAIEGHISEAISFIRGSSSIDGAQKYKLINAVSGSEVSDPLALNRLRQGIMEGKIQTFEGIASTEGVSFSDIMNARVLLQEVKKPEKEFVTAQLQKLPKLFNVPKGFDTISVVEEAKLKAFNSIQEDLKRWEKAGENVQEKLTMEYLKQRVEQYTPTMEDLVRAQREAFNPSKKEETREEDIRETLFKKHTPEFSAFVYDYFNAGNALPGAKPLKYISWERVQTFLENRKVRPWLKKKFLASKK